MPVKRATTKRPPPKRPPPRPAAKAGSKQVAAATTKPAIKRAATPGVKRATRPATGPNRPAVARAKRASVTPGVDRWRRELLELVNETRRRHGVGPVRLNAVLHQVARRHNADQAFVLGGISHVGSDGRRIGGRLRRVGYEFRYASENVAAGQKNPRHVHRSFMRSEGHRRNVLNPVVDEMGVHVGWGYDGRLYWTQVFGKQKSA